MAHEYSAEGRQSTKQQRIKELNSDDAQFKDLPEGYAFNSNKEELCLEYVRNFNDKFTSLYPKRIPLYLIAPNEYGIDKFVPTTVRPTLLPYREIYDMEKTSSFVANYLEYEPLEDPTQPPSCLPSPAQVIEWGVGDSFDLAMVLASFLLGAGYDAFVVQGTAPRWVCLRDQSHCVCPLLAKNAASSGAVSEEKGEDEGEDAKAEGKTLDSKPSAYDRPALLAPQSAFERRKEEAKEEAARKEKEELEAWDSDEDTLDGEDGQPKEDDDGLRGKRVHAWVLVRGGKREAKGLVFIEPSTGAIYPTHQSPYLSIEAVWNAGNYFVNMQGDRSVRELNFDLFDVRSWEFVFFDPRNPLTATNQGGSQGGANMEETKGDDVAKGSASSGTEQATGDVGEENVLDVPPSWVRQLGVSRESFKVKFPPSGQRTILYKRAKLELFADHLHGQGTVSRLTTYKDRNQTVVKECREAFLDRRDRLVNRTRYPLEGRTVEEFAPGRVEALKTLINVSGRKREMHFYVEARQDGLSFRQEDVSRKIIEIFEGRGDRMVYRSATLTEDDSGNAKPAHTLPTSVPHGGAGGGMGGGGQPFRKTNVPDLVIHKMALKFERNGRLPADQDLAKRTFYLSENRIRSQFHYPEGRITRRTVHHAKDKAANSQLHMEAASRIPSDADLEALQEVIGKERDCLQNVRRAHIQALEILENRQSEEDDILVDRPIYETARERRAEVKAKETVDRHEDVSNGFHVDYLTPFLQSVANPAAITRDEAQRARDNCLKSLKDRLLERANIIQNRLNEENARLSKRQATFQRNSSRENDPVAEEEFEKFCSEAMFRIQILEQRLVNHEETALKKYQDLDDKLSSDPRLSVLHR